MFCFAMSHLNTKMRFTPIALSLILLFSCAEDAELKRTRSLANAGDATAQYNLGVMYRKGDGVPQDYEKAFKWNKLSADQGYVKAQRNLVHLTLKEMECLKIMKKHLDFSSC